MQARGQSEMFLMVKNDLSSRWHLRTSSLEEQIVGHPTLEVLLSNPSQDKEKDKLVGERWILHLIECLRKCYRSSQES